MGSVPVHPAESVVLHPGRVAAPLILLSQNRQAATDRVKAEHDYQVDQLALQYLIAWHTDTHGKDCPCVQPSRPVVDNPLTALDRDL